MAWSFRGQASIVLTTCACAGAAHGQQLLHRMTDAQCQSVGGHIITYTNTAGVGPDIGDCLVPPRIRGGGVGGGGRAGDLGRALDDLGGALGTLGDVFGRRHAPPAEPDPDAQRRAWQAHCNAEFNEAKAEVDAGNDRADRYDPGGAIPHYERAIGLLRECGNSRAVAIVEKNLAIAQKRYAAVRPDDRVPDARRRFGGDDPYRDPNPFGGADQAPRGAAPGAGKPAAAAAASSCDDFGGTLDPGGACRVIGITRSDCEDSLHGQLTTANGYQYCEFDPAAAADDEGAPAGAPPGSLRDRIANKMRRPQPAPGRVGQPAAPATAAAAPQGGAATSPDPVSTSGSDRDALLHDYLNSRDPTTGGTRGGDLGARRPGFTNLPPLPLGKDPQEGDR
jgi:hypothetical protein